MQKGKIIEEILDKIKKHSPESVYIYGSALREDFNPKKSDIDLLVFLSDDKEATRIIKNIKKEFKGFKIKVDLNVCFAKEFKYRVHVDKPITYYLGIKEHNVLLYGKDILKEFKEEAKPAEIYKRAVNLCQRLRHAYLNNKDIAFWCKKSKKWLQTLVLETEYLEGGFYLNYKDGIKVFHMKHPKIKTKKLLEKNYNIKDAINLAEKIKKYIEKKHCL